MKPPKVPRVGLHVSNTVYIPVVKSFVPAKAFETNLYKVMVYKDCESFDGEYQYRYILFVYRRGGDGTPCFAVSSSTNSFVEKLKEAGHALGGSYTLGVFPCDGKMQHLNLGLSDEWADLEKFTVKALSIFQEHLAVSEAPIEVPVPEQMRKRLAFYKEKDGGTSQRKKGWWEFWKK